MSLPPSYNDSRVYLSETIDFLCDYHWLYSYPNTHLLVNEVFTNISKEWLPYLQNLNNNELNELPFGYYNENWPDSLQTFVQKLQSLKPRIQKPEYVEILDVPQNFFKGLSVKKKHEILSLAPVVQENCKNVDLIVDVGAGLGYLPQLLHKKYGYKILAIEADHKKLEAAQKRQKTLYPESTNFVKYVQHLVNENSADTMNDFVSEFIKSEPQNIKIGLIGLHACADLSITMLKLFFKMDNIKNIVVMPCCYHRMDKNFEKFTNFPISDTLKNIFKQKICHNFLNSTFLRLACQNSSAVWRKMASEEHVIHSTDLLRRNILQLVVEKGRYQMCRLKRKTRSTDEIDEYIQEIQQNHTIYDPKIKNNVPIKVLGDQIKKYWEIYKEKLQLISVYTAFQNSLQSICENLVLLDRVLFLKDLGLDGAAIKVADEELSPRCYALVAKKQFS